MSLHSTRRPAVRSKSQQRWRSSISRGSPLVVGRSLPQTQRPVTCGVLIGGLLRGGWPDQAKSSCASKPKALERDRGRMEN